MIYLKTEEEIELLRAANQLVSATLAEIAKVVKPGVTTLELDALAEQFIRDHGAIPTFKGFPASFPDTDPFPASICASVNEVVVHGLPTAEPLKDGDIVSIDCGTFLNGFCGDSAYTFCVGEVCDEVKRLLRTTKESLYKGIDSESFANSSVTASVVKCTKNPQFPTMVSEARVSNSKMVSASPSNP